MFLKRKICQNRRDFRAVYECETCGSSFTDHGYDDEYFHNKVIPAMVCKKCGATGKASTPRSTPDVDPWAVL